MNIDLAINQEFFSPTAEFCLYLQDLNRIYPLQDSGEGCTIQMTGDLPEKGLWRKFDSMSGVE